MAGGQLRIERMYAYVALDPADNTEGVVSFQAPGGIHMPMVGADLDRMHQLWPMAERIAQQTGCTVRLLLFEQRTEIDRIGPATGKARA